MEQKLPDFSPPQQELMASFMERVLAHCGVGFGKSHCIGNISGDFVINNPEVKGFIGANTYGQLSKSTLERVFEVWQYQFGWMRDVNYVVDVIPPTNWPQHGVKLKSYENTISFDNGALVFTASLDNYKVIDGTEFGWACLDETKDTKEEAVKECIIARLRQQGMYVTPWGTISKVDGEGFKGYAPLFIFTSPAKTDWLIKWFELDKHFEDIARDIFTPGKYYKREGNNKLVIIASTYWNEKNLKKGYIEQLIQDFKHDKNLIDMLIYGSPLAKLGNEFYHCFDRLLHVQDQDPMYGPAMHLSFDFNAQPYMTLTCYQITRGEDRRNKVNQFDEICLEAPRNNTQQLCEEYIARWGKKTTTIFYYGDYSGKNANTLTPEYKHHYEVIEKYLKKYLHNHSNRVIVNPFVIRRRDFMNKIFAGSLPIDYRMHSRCVKTIDDYLFVKEHADGGKISKDKTKVKDKATGKSIEPYGHTSDSADYFFCSAFNPLFEQN